MKIFSGSSFVILVTVSLIQTGFVRGNSVCGGTFEGDSGDFEYHRENTNNVDDSTGSSVCVWMIKLLTADGAGVSLKVEGLDENSVVNLYDEGEPTDPLNAPITLNSSQINSAVELSGKIFILTLKSQLEQFENPPTKLVISWSSIKASSKVDWKSNGSEVLPVEITSTNYYAADGEKGRYNFKNFHPFQKSVWILDAGFGENLHSEVNVKFDSSCLSKLKSEMSPKILCECSYFGLFEIVPSTGKLRSVNENCGRSDSSTFTKLSSQLVVFVYAKHSDSGPEESVEISWEKNKETTNPPTTTTTTEFPITITTTELPSSPEPPIEASICPDNSTIAPCTCNLYESRVDIRCEGSAVNQRNIENSFREIRRVNGIPSERGVHMHEFGLLGTELTEVDMSPFYGNKVILFMRYNYALTKLVTSGNPQDYGSIHAIHFAVWSSPIDRTGYGDVLKYFSNEMTEFLAEHISLFEDNISGEFLPGLSAHTNVKTLYLYNCSITGRLDSDTWIPKELRNLEFIYLASNNINGIGENVFDFYEPDIYLPIYLQYNKLNESSFHPNSGISRAGRATALFLNSNQITTLPAPIFETFLDTHYQNSLDLQDNPLICDERLIWLKSRRDEPVLQARVAGAYCSNDPGRTVFNSDLIPDLKNKN